jgi:hypothetical protein
MCKNKQNKIKYANKNLDFSHSRVVLEGVPKCLGCSFRVAQLT